jgi:hypothetical protein
MPDSKLQVRLESGIGYPAPNGKENRYQAEPEKKI